MKITTSILLLLARAYVPRLSQWPNSELDHINADESYWPAHELGHLLMAAPREIGAPLFGLLDVDDAKTYDGPQCSENYLRSMECAAMTVSSTLLRRAGRDDLAEEEREYTDESTLFWPRAYANKLRAVRCPRIPRTAQTLELACAQQLARAKAAQCIPGTTITGCPKVAAFLRYTELRLGTPDARSHDHA